MPHTLIATRQCMHAEPASHAAVESWTVGDTDTAHDGADQVGLHGSCLLANCDRRLVISVHV
jgi:hypothetical protein